MILPLMGLVVEDAIFSALVAMGFGMLFNVPRRLLVWCMLGGALGHALRTLLLQLVPDTLAVSTLVACLALGIYAQAASTRLKSPSLIFQVTGAITMVPGAFAYQSILGALALAGLPVSGISVPLLHFAQNFFITGVLLGAIAFGIILPSLIFQRFRPVV